MGFERLDSEDEAPVTRRVMRKREYKRLILKAAEEVFLEKGFRSTTIDEIADRAGITKRTLYKLFPSKLALYVDMYDDYLHELGAELAAAAKQQLPSDELVLVMFDTLFEFTKSNEKFFRLYWMLDSDEFEGDIPDELVHHVKERTRFMFKKVIPVIRRSQKDGKVLDLNPLLLTHLMSAINKGIFTHTNKDRRFEIANISPNKLYEILKIILRQGLIRSSRNRHSNLKQ